MKVAVYCESPADQAAIRVFVDAIVGPNVIHANDPLLRPRSWPGVMIYLPTALKHLYFQTDADVLVAVVDSDKSKPHANGHPEISPQDWDCRWCEMRDRIAEVQSKLPTLQGRNRLQVAIGLAVPAMEAWLLCDQNVHLGEIPWTRALADQSFPYDTQKLKVQMYGTARPDLNLETRIMVQRATELSTQISLLEQRFPGGFKPLADALRRAAAPQP